VRDTARMGRVRDFDDYLETPAAGWRAWAAEVTA
jgi:hypothetical protein